MHADSEFEFELQVCQWAERNWPPDREPDGPVVVARQLGTQSRRWDTLVVECEPEGLRQRARFGPEHLDSDLLGVVRHAPPEWAWYRDALPEPAYPWRYVREAVNRAADRGVIDRRTRNGRVQLRRRWEYPDWVRRLVAIENKPDLDASAARRLVDQMERDVALGLADEVWIATQSTDHRVEPALLEETPVEAGILLIEGDARGPDAATVAWQPQSLAVEAAGTRIQHRPAGGTHDASACAFEYADPAWKARKRREIAERAYERGWRAYVSTMCSDCRHFGLEPERAVATPYCGAKERTPTPSECSRSCQWFEPEQPAWRQQGWPLDGGPGKTIERLLARQRDRQRPGE